MKEQIAIALDVPNLDQARKLYEQVEPYVGVVKIGLELFISCGPEIFKYIKLPIFLDLKLHDIPTTVERSVAVAIDHGVKFLTLHCDQQFSTLDLAARKAEGKLTLLGVSVLTSMARHDLASLDIYGTVAERVEFLVYRAYQAGIGGFVCSAQEVKKLRENYPEYFLAVPGIRTDGTMQDQARVGNPKQTLQDGASLLVIGRAIRDAADPGKAAAAILAGL